MNLQFIKKFNFLWNFHMLELHRKCISGVETGISRVNYVNIRADDDMVMK